MAGAIFRGENVDPEMWDECQGRRWASWVAIFLPLINNRHGFFQHFPFAGAYMDQPAATMRVLQSIMGVYQEYVAEVNRVPGA